MQCADPQPTELNENEKMWPFLPSDILGVYSSDDKKHTVSVMGRVFINLSDYSLDLPLCAEDKR